MNASSSKKRPLAVFRFDASPDIGGGHALRCMTLAQALRGAGWECLFAVGPFTPDSMGNVVAPETRWLVLDGLDGPGGEARRIAAELDGRCDLLVVDHYGRDRTFEESCRAWTAKILVIDDLADRPHDCDVLLDQTLGRNAADYAPLVPDGGRLLLGCDYALLNSRFAGKG